MNPYLKEDLHNSAVLFRKNIVILVITIFSYLANYFFNVYLARITTPKYYGDIVLVLQLLTFFVPLALFGSELSMVRYISKYLAKEDLGRASGFLKWSLKIFITTSVIILFFGSLIIFGYELLKKEGAIKAPLHIFLYSFWLIPLYATITFQATFLQVLKHYYMSAISQGVGRLILMILSIFFLAPLFTKVIPGDIAGLNLILCIGIAFLVVNIMQMISLKTFLPKNLFNSPPVYERKEWSIVSIQMMGSTLMFAGLMAIDIFMIDIIAKNEAAVGFFASIVVIASAVTVFGGAIDMILNPRISYYVERDEKEHLQDMLNVMNTFKIVPAVLFTFLVIYFGHPLLSFFGKDFTGAYSSLVLLAISFLIGLCFSAAGPLLTYSQHQALSFKISLAQLIYIIVLDFVFIPFYGVLGAVIVLGSSILLSSLLRIYFVRKYLRVKSFYFL